MKTKWQCPNHRKALNTNQDNPGILMHLGCPHIFTVINNRLYVQNKKKQWEDAENGNTIILNQMTEHLYEILIFDKEGKVIESIILTAFERDRIPRRRNQNEETKPSKDCKGTRYQ